MQKVSQSYVLFQLMLYQVPTDKAAAIYSYL